MCTCRLGWADDSQQGSTATHNFYTSRRRQAVSRASGYLIQEGDLVGVWVDPHQHCVRFYLNGRLLLDSAQENAPLPEFLETGYGIYVLVDDIGDQIEIESFGYGEFDDSEVLL